MPEWVALGTTNARGRMATSWVSYLVDPNAGQHCNAIEQLQTACGCAWCTGHAQPARIADIKD
eukprot:5746525-Lingulodinium_polyedra.AAC.1